ncbi:hypothetical protein ABG79_02155 [Caloramator mitchellensis]|uniref:Uncharacterized protein n=1 Tax=Caloramator mitchellensis TaxID=908809 RepID=A0A0R3JRC4_CALMK|nr:hypothetical protein [Caloramator mitchellensis]KRQ86023.1 hypothetical protein ABG79_02155 [Caloramator mitchellensis]
MAKENFLNDYIEVNERIIKFYEKYPEGSIQTEILKWENGLILMRAYAYRHPDDIRPAIAHAYEKEDSSYINKTSVVENCETSAVGRALALLGFEVKKAVASKEEVQRAVEQQEQLKKKEQTTNNDMKCSKCGATITKAVKAYSEQYYGKTLCQNCQKTEKKIEGQ